MDELIGYAEPICSEIERSIDFFRSTFGAESIGKVLLSGGGAMLPGILNNVGNRLGIETEIINPFKKIACDKKVLDKETAERVGPLAAVGVGLALRKIGESIFCPIGKRKNKRVSCARSSSSPLLSWCLF
jgi:type IV pilus assembly protein PilM